MWGGSPVYHNVDKCDEQGLYMCVVSVSHKAVVRHQTPCLPGMLQTILSEGWLQRGRLWGQACCMWRQWGGSGKGHHRPYMAPQRSVPGLNHEFFLGNGPIFSYLTRRGTNQYANRQWFPLTAVYLLLVDIDKQLLLLVWCVQASEWIKIND